MIFMHINLPIRKVNIVVLSLCEIKGRENCLKGYLLNAFILYQQN